MFEALAFSNNIFWGLCNFTAYQATRRLALTSTGYYGNRSWEHIVRACNALYKLGVSVETVNRAMRWLEPGAFVIDFRKCTILVSTRNCLNNASNEKLKRVLSRVQEIYRTVLIYPFFQINFSENPSWLGVGVCQGMVQQFIKEYLRNTQKGETFEEAATNAAGTIMEDEEPNIEACALQLLHESLEFDTSKLDQEGYDPDFKFRTHLTGRANIGYASFLPEFPTLYVEMRRPLTLTKFPLLEDGIYNISLGWKVIKEDEDVFWSSPTGCGHAIALIINAGHVLIFDPNYGLISCENHSDYFDWAKFFETDNGYSISRICLDKPTGPAHQKFPTNNAFLRMHSFL